MSSIEGSGCQISLPPFSPCSAASYALNGEGAASQFSKGSKVQNR